MYGYFKCKIDEISHEKTLTWLGKGNLKGKTEALLTAAHDNAIRANYDNEKNRFVETK